MSFILKTLLIGLVILVGWRLSSFGMRPKGYPPGPPTLPILGNLHQLSIEGMHLKFKQWAETYGPIYSLKLGAQTMIILNKDHVVKELLDRRGQNYSGRPDVFVRKFGRDLNILLRTNDDVWRRSRKMYHLRLNSTVADFYIPYQKFECIDLLNGLLDGPANPISAHFKRFTTSLASTIIYGWRTTNLDNHLITQMFEWIDGFSKLASRSQVADFFPILQPFFTYIPESLSWFKKEATRLNQLEIDTWIPLFNIARDKHLSGIRNPCFCRDMILSKDKDGITELEMAFNAGHGFAGATDTTLNTLLAFVKAMILYPKVRHRAQAEIDEVVGPSRLPDWADFDKLHYLRSIMKETLRWAPTTLTGGMPHATRVEDEYMGYKIPAGASVLNNVWAINNDPTRAADPRRFDPERYAEDFSTIGESANLQDPTKRDNFTFGAGRRICPGLHVAERSLFITMSSLLWAFEFDYFTDDQGNKDEIVPDAITSGFVCAPVPYNCSVRPRENKRAELIRQEFAKNRSFLDVDGNYLDEFYARFK